MMAASPLRVRLDGPAELHARAAWALEALLARARVLEWRIVEDDDADLVWGPGQADLPCDPASWQFRWDATPDAALDPLASTFWWLARVEEQLAPDEAFGEHDRFRYEASAVARLPDPLSAPVDELAVALAQGVLAPWRTQSAVDEPAWRLVLTHDIDLPWRWTRAGRRRALRALRGDLRRGRVGSALRTVGTVLAIPVWRLVGSDPWDNARRIARLEARHGASSTSYLLVGRHAPEDGDEELHERGAQWARALSAAQGGLHGSYTSSVADGRLADERAQVEQRLGAPVTDHRFHYLRHRPVDAWPLLARAGITSDSSLGFAEHPGFRAGTAHPFRAWDHGAGTPLDLVVIPLACMDASFDERYLGLRSRREVNAMVDEVLDHVVLHDGAASLLIHNDRLCNGAPGGWTRTYRAILRDVRRTGGVACTAAEAADWYRRLLPSSREGVPRP